jgi:hypothetical protein
VRDALGVNEAKIVYVIDDGRTGASLVPLIVT